MVQDDFTGTNGDAPDVNKWNDISNNDAAVEISSNELACSGGSGVNEFGGVAVKNFPSSFTELKVTVTVKYQTNSNFFINLLSTLDNDQYIVNFQGTDILLSAIDNTYTVLDGWAGSYVFNSITPEPDTPIIITITINSTNITVNVYKDAAIPQEQEISHALSSDLPLTEINICSIFGGQDSGGAALSFFDDFKLEKK